MISDHILHHNNIYTHANIYCIFKESMKTVATYVGDQTVLYSKRQKEMFEKATQRVEHKLDGFVNDIKFMQKVSI